MLRMADERLVTLDAGEAGPERLDYGYAITVHRSQGGTIDTGHRLADGGGRELAYVSMSRARDRSTVYVVADDLDQACSDLTHDWTVERRRVTTDKRLGVRVPPSALIYQGLYRGVPVDDPPRGNHVVTI